MRQTDAHQTTWAVCATFTRDRFTSAAQRICLFFLLVGGLMGRIWISLFIFGNMHMTTFTGRTLHWTLVTHRRRRHSTWTTCGHLCVSLTHLNRIWIRYNHSLLIVFSSHMKSDHREVSIFLASSISVTLRQVFWLFNTEWNARTHVMTRPVWRPAATALMHFGYRVAARSAVCVLFCVSPTLLAHWKLTRGLKTCATWEITCQFCWLRRNTLDEVHQCV
jgi:hypothetical protein